jgi:hypothetical protein
MKRNASPRRMGFLLAVGGMSCPVSRLQPLYFRSYNPVNTVGRIDAGNQIQNLNEQILANAGETSSPAEAQQRELALQLEKARAEAEALASATAEQAERDRAAREAAANPSFGHTPVTPAIALAPSVRPTGAQLHAQYVTGPRFGHHRRDSDEAPAPVRDALRAYENSGLRGPGETLDEAFLNSPKFRSVFWAYLASRQLDPLAFTMSFPPPPLFYSAYNAYLPLALPPLPYFDPYLYPGAFPPMGPDGDPGMAPPPMEPGADGSVMFRGRRAPAKLELPPELANVPLKPVPELTKAYETLRDSQTRWGLNPAGRDEVARSKQRYLESARAFGP